MIIALVRGATVIHATKQANVDRTTFYTWLKTEANFQAELNRAKQQQTNGMRAQLWGLAETPLQMLREILVSSEVTPGVRLKAVLAVLQSAGTLEPELIGDVNTQRIESDLALEPLT